MNNSKAKTASAPVATEGSDILGIVVPTTEYPNTRFLAGRMIGTDKQEHDIQVVRRGSNGNTRHEVLMGLNRDAKNIGELVRVNGHLEGSIGSREVGGIFRAGGRIMIIPKASVRNWGTTASASKISKTLDQLKEELNAPVPVTVDDSNVPF